MMNNRKRRAFGYYRQRASGNWEANYPYLGKRYTALHTFASELEAQAWLASEKQLIDSGNWSPPGNRMKIKSDDILFLDFCNLWLDNKKNRYGDPIGLSTRYGMLNTINREFGYFDKKHITEITTNDIAIWYKQIEETHTKRRASSIYHLLVSIFKSATTTDITGRTYLEKSPATLPIKWYTKTEKPRKAFTPHQLAQLQEALPESISIIIPLCGILGLRMSEAQGIQRKHLDLEKLTLRVEQKWSRTNEAGTKGNRYGVRDDMKTPASFRTLTIPSNLRDVFQYHLNNYVLSSDEGFVLVGKLPIRPAGRTYLLKEFKLAVAEIGLNPDDYVIHSLRHTAGTLMAERGFNTKVIMERMGHSNINSTVVYQHPTEKQQLQAAEELNDVIEPVYHLKDKINKTLLGQLSTKEQQVLEWWQSDRTKSLQEIADEVGVSRERIRHIEMLVKTAKDEVQEKSIEQRKAELKAEYERKLADIDAHKDDVRII